MKLKLICDVDIEVSIEELSNYLIKIGYTEINYMIKNIRRFKKIYEDDLRDFKARKLPLFECGDELLYFLFLLHIYIII